MGFVSLAIFIVTSLGLLSNNVLNESPDNFTYQCKHENDRPYDNRNVEHYPNMTYTRHNHARSDTVVVNNYHGGWYYPWFWDSGCYGHHCRTGWGSSNWGSSGTTSKSSSSSKSSSKSDNGGEIILLIVVSVIMIVLSVFLLFPLYSHIYCMYPMMFNSIWGASALALAFSAYKWYQMERKTSFNYKDHDKKNVLCILTVFLATNTIIQTVMSVQHFHLLNIVLGMVWLGSSMFFVSWLCDL